RPQTAPRDDATVGDFLDQVKATADIRPNTLEGYCVALRKILSDVFKIDGGSSKFDYRSGGRAKWIDQIHAIKLAKLRPEVVQKWKRDFLKKAEGDPLRERAAATSVNSFLRRAKSLFAPDAIKHVSIRLPSPLPFSQVKFEPRQSMRYRSSINAEELTK